jgi:hypothetical protein
MNSPATPQRHANERANGRGKAITPFVRSDFGQHRKIMPEMSAKILELRKLHPEISVVKFYGKCLGEGIVGNPPLCSATIRNFLKHHNLMKPNSIVARKRFEMGVFGELWTGDYMHGPQVVIGKKKKKAILFAIIDDHSRLIVGSEFGYHENTLSLELVFKSAILTHGIPDRIYLDNGPSFSSNYLAKACANLGIGLVHSKPYDSPSRGKIERFFRTVREGFLVQIRPQEELSIEELNERFKIWLRDDYHRSFHQGIQMRPLDRYNISIMNYPRKQIDPEVLNEHFLVSFERTVRKDATISYLGKVYEVPARFIGKTVEIRHIQNDLNNVFIYENDKRVICIKEVDAVANSKIFRPQKVDQISFTSNEQREGRC